MVNYPNITMDVILKYFQNSIYQGKWPSTTRLSLLHNLIMENKLSDFSYSSRTCTTTTTRGFHSSIGIIPFDVSRRILGFFSRNFAPYKSLSLGLGFPFLKPKKKRMEEFFLMHNKIKKP
jgi:hypothetical protein